jgi:hypothetical protein
MVRMAEGEDVDQAVWAGVGTIAGAETVTID